MDIREALSQLDTLDDDQWTTEGAPKIEAVKELLGSPVTRQDIINAAPHFSRENPILEEEKTDGEEIEGQGLEEVAFDPEALEEFKAGGPLEIKAFLKFLESIPTKGLHDLKKIIEDQHQQIIETRKLMDEMELRVRHSLLYTNNRISHEIPDMTDAEANQAYIRKQAEMRAAKHVATSQLLKGVDLKSLDPRAPIDRAMARKTARGANRPNIPVKG